MRTTCALLIGLLAFVSVSVIASGRGTPRRDAIRTTPVHMFLSDENDPDDEGDDEISDELFAEYFQTDPLADPRTVVTGASIARVAWEPEPPVFPGDPAGSMTVLYDSSLAPGLLGFPLPASFHENSIFTAAAVFVIDSAEFVAEDDGFFQISWGLWNSQTTGLNRTGSLSAAADTYELIDFDYFPNVSNFFGGPFVGPAVFGIEPTGGDAFANFSGIFDLEVALPLDVPLLAVMEHRPDLNALVVQVYLIVDSNNVLPLQGAVGIVPLEFLGPRQYEFDVVGLTLWQDGFDGLFAPSPAVYATLSYHAIVVVPGVAGRPEDLLDVVSE